VRGVSTIEYMIIVGVVALLSMAAYAAFGKDAQGLADREGECVRTFQCSDGSSGGMPSGNGVANDPPPGQNNGGGATPPGGGTTPAAASKDPTQAAIDHAREIVGGGTWQSASRAQQEEYVKYVRSLDEATAKAVFDENATRRGQEVDQSVWDGLTNVVMNSKVKVNVDIFGMRGEVAAGLSGIDFTGKTVPVTLAGASLLGVKGEILGEAGFSTDGGGVVAITARGRLAVLEAKVKVTANDTGANVKPSVQIGRNIPIASAGALGLAIGANFEIGAPMELPH
jgi:hypothetical protein